MDQESSQNTIPHHITLQTVLRVRLPLYMTFIAMTMVIAFEVYGSLIRAVAPVNPYSDLKAQKAFEKGLLEKTAKQNADIILYDNRIVLYKSESDVMMYVVGSVDENEIMLYNVILALRDSLHLLFKYVTTLPS